MTVTGSYFWACVTMKLREERLARSGRPLNQRVADVLIVQVPEVRRLVFRFEDRQTLPILQVGAGPLARMPREQEAEVGGVGVEQRQSAQIVRRIAGHDREPGVQEVVTLLVERSVVPGKDFDAFGHAAIQPGRVAVIRDDRQGTRAEDVALDLQRGQALPQLVDGRRGGLVDEHVLRGRLRTEVVDQRDPLVEEMALTRMEIASHPRRGQALPFQARDERARDRVRAPAGCARTSSRAVPSSSGP